MLVVFLVFAGSTLFVNGMHLIRSNGTAAERDFDGKDAAVLNIFTGMIGLCIVVVTLAKYATDATMLPSAAYIALFALTYIWVGINAFTGANGKALGWFSFIVPFVGIPAGVNGLQKAASVFEYWMAVNWFAWSILWFLFFLLLAREIKIPRFTGYMAVAQAVGTALVPAVLSFYGAI